LTGADLHIPDKDIWQAWLKDGAAELGIGLSAQQLDRFYRHALEMLRWNARTNLTAITDAQGIAVKHFLDAIGPLPLMTACRQIVDLGSGAGFPGLPLKVLRPETPALLVDSSRKKVSFLNHLIRQLGLTAVQALHARGEDVLQGPQYGTRDTIVVTRACSDLTRLAAMAASVLESGGRLIAWKGPRAAQEAEGLEALRPKLSRPLTVAYFRYRLPFVAQWRTAVVLQLGESGCSKRRIAGTGC
jgi:16S rRNA (guanine527-N7)-methyltransferase